MVQNIATKDNTEFFVYLLKNMPEISEFLYFKDIEGKTAFSKILKGTCKNMQLFLKVNKSLQKVQFDYFKPCMIVNYVELNGIEAILALCKIEAKYFKSFMKNIQKYQKINRQ